MQHRIIAEFQMKEQWRRCWIITSRRRSSPGAIVSSTLLLFLLIIILVGGCFSYWILLQRTISIDSDDIVGRGGDDQRASKQIKPSQKSIVDFLEWSDPSACRMIHGLGGAMRRWGMINQKSVCFDDSVKPRQDRCLIYSFSFHDDNNSNDDWLMLEEQFSLYGCQVHLFDPKGNKTSRTLDNNIHWHNWALSGSRQNRVGGEGAWEMRTMDSIYESLSHIHGNMIIDYVKLDLEYGEWSVLPQLLESGILDKIRQLNVELHLPSLSELEEFQRWTKMIGSLEDYGLVRFDSRPNSGCIRWIESLNQTTYCGFDLTWYNKKLQRAVSTQRPLDW